MTRSNKLFSWSIVKKINLFVFCDVMKYDLFWLLHIRGASPFHQYCRADLENLMGSSVLLWAILMENYLDLILLCTLPKICEHSLQFLVSNTELVMFVTFDLCRQFFYSRDGIKSIGMDRKRKKYYHWSFFALYYLNYSFIEILYMGLFAWGVSREKCLHK